MKAFNELPARIRQVRLGLGLSQENMADGLQISTTAYGDLERGKTEITISRLATIADIFSLDVSDLLADTGAKEEMAKLKQENEKLFRLNSELTFKNRLLEQRLEKLSAPDPERRRIGF